MFGWSRVDMTVISFMKSALSFSEGFFLVVLTATITSPGVPLCRMALNTSPNWPEGRWTSDHKNKLATKADRPSDQDTSYCTHTHSIHMQSQTHMVYVLILPTPTTLSTPTNHSHHTLTHTVTQYPQRTEYKLTLPNGNMVRERWRWDEESFFLEIRRLAQVIFSDGSICPKKKKIWLNLFHSGVYHKEVYVHTKLF